MYRENVAQIQYKHAVYCAPESVQYTVIHNTKPKSGNWIVQGSSKTTKYLYSDDTIMMSCNGTS